MQGLPVPLQTAVCACPKALIIGPKGSAFDGRDPDAPFTPAVASVELGGAVFQVAQGQARAGKQSSFLGTATRR